MGCFKCIYNTLLAHFFVFSAPKLFFRSKYFLQQGRCLRPRLSAYTPSGLTHQAGIRANP